MNGVRSNSGLDKKEGRRGRLGITRGQAILFLLSFALFFYLLTELVFASSAKGSVDLPEAPVQAESVMEVTVVQGDSLWKLANLYKNDANPDVPELVEKIKEINGLDEVIIYPGQTLRIPLG
ncbi:LysM peptidoglycan-binding domain-containing protein [Brevibacillus sp. TJ4]|uniref:LysM peptidoglycan-binding domain-containing protein n=1 Tax=Brevibacillus sp. TJ4 TaxID=3234853 RepID=UPI0037CF1EA7